MNPRWLLVPAAMAVLAGGVYHRHSLRVASNLDAEIHRVRAKSIELGQKTSELARRTDAARAEAQTLAAARAERSQARSTLAARAVANDVGSASKTVAASDLELQPLRTQVFVSEQRLRFGGLLKRLGFTSEKFRAFDELNAAYQQVMLDPSQSGAARQLATETRQAALRELFGPAFDQWQEANRIDPSRTVVAQIVQQTFQSSGALTTAQAEELTRIVSQHRLAPSGDPRVAQLRYNWEAIIEDAVAILPEVQRNDVITAIEYRRASDQMSVIASRKKP